MATDLMSSLKVSIKSFVFFDYSISKGLIFTSKSLMPESDKMLLILTFFLWHVSKVNFIFLHNYRLDFFHPGRNCKVSTFGECWVWNTSNPIPALNRGSPKTLVNFIFWTRLAFQTRFSETTDLISSFKVSF